MQKKTNIINIDMAIRILRTWPTIIINVKKANKKLEGGLVALLSSYYPPKEKSMFEKIKGLFSSSKPLTLAEFDNMHFSSGMRVLGENGCDGNLYFFSYSNKDKIDEYIRDLESKALVSNRNSPDCDFYIYDDNEKAALPCKWLRLLMKEEPASEECIMASYTYFSIYPFKMPYTLQNEWQGDISYYSHYAWEIFQTFVKAGNAKGMKDIEDIQIRHLNAKLWDNKIPDINEFIKAYVDRNISNIDSKYHHVLDGSKDRNEVKMHIITYALEQPKVSELQSTPSNPTATKVAVSVPTKKEQPAESKHSNVSQDKSVTSKSTIYVDIIGKYFHTEQIVSKKFGDKLFLMPIDCGIVMNEFHELDTIPLLAKDAADFTKYLPGMDFSTKESTLAFFRNFVQLTEWGQKFGYTLRIEGIISSFIFINTPDYNKKSIGFEGWTIDVATFPMFQRQHLLKGIIPYVLAFLKNELNVKSLYAIINQENYKCINLLSQIRFDDTGKTLTNPQDNSIAKLYECPLSTINFVRR